MDNQTQNSGENTVAVEIDGERHVLTDGQLGEVAGRLSTRDRIKTFVERIERLEEDKKGIGEDIKEVFSEAKGEGYDIKAMRHVIKLRKMDGDERTQLEETVDLYLDACGMPKQGMLI